VSLTLTPQPEPIPFENTSWVTEGDNLLTRYTGSAFSLPSIPSAPPVGMMHLERLSVQLTLGLSFKTKCCPQRSLEMQFDGFSIRNDQRNHGTV